jgi:hypothetical protein
MNTVVIHHKCLQMANVIFVGLLKRSAMELFAENGCRDELDAVLAMLLNDHSQVRTS